MGTPPSSSRKRIFRLDDLDRQQDGKLFDTLNEKYIQYFSFFNMDLRKTARCQSHRQTGKKLHDCHTKQPFDYYGREHFTIW